MVTLSLFRFAAFSSRYWAFQGMATAHPGLQRGDAPIFCKLLGTGAGGGFRWYPNFAVYAVLATWRDKEHAQAYFNSNPMFGKYLEKSVESLTLWLRPYTAHGSWGQKRPFKTDGSTPDDDQRIAVLTRARIRTSRLPEFWSKVAGVSRATDQASGRLFSLGIGEWPLFEQATFSLWESERAMKAFAYSSNKHKEVIQKTRERGWYSEELFARFTLMDLNGSWDGLVPGDSAIADSPVLRPPGSPTS